MENIIALIIFIGGLIITLFACGGLAFLFCALVTQFFPNSKLGKWIEADDQAFANLSDRSLYEKMRSHSEKD